MNFNIDVVQIGETAWRCTKCGMTDKIVIANTTKTCVVSCFRCHKNWSISKHALESIRERKSYGPKH